MRLIISINKECNMAKIENTSKITSKFELPDSSTSEYTTGSNIAVVENTTTGFTKVRQSEKSNVLPEDKVKQTLTLTNLSEDSITDITVKDTISSDANFVYNSVTINGESKPDLNPVVGFNLENELAPNENFVIEYQIQIAVEPTTDSINTVSTVYYSTRGETGLSENSNVVEMDISIEKITIKKTSTLSAVIKGQTLTFQNVIKNEGNKINTDVVFKDILPPEVEFVENTVKFDGELQENLNPVTGFSLNDLNPHDEITITFDVLVK